VAVCVWAGHSHLPRPGGRERWSRRAALPAVAGVGV